MTLKPPKRVIHLIAAARPNFMKVAPLYHELVKTEWATPILVHTGQHYDRNMAGDIMDQLALPTPQISLGVGSGSHAEQTGNTMIAYEKVCLKNRPDLIVVVGDVNATVACALVAAKMQIPLAHLEAGLRSFDRTMPEEINRIVTDRLSDILWIPSEDARENLLREGVSEEKIEFVGNIMIDSLLMLKPAIENVKMAEQLELQQKKYGVVTIHRPSNVDEREILGTLVDAMIRLSQNVPLVFPLHPRTRKQLEGFGLFEKLKTCEGVTLLNPLPYIEFMSLVGQTAFVVTDSGGIQEETTYLGIPCVTLRENTERPITVSLGTNRLCSANVAASMSISASMEMARGAKIPPLWDGETAQRVTQSVCKFFKSC